MIQLPIIVYLLSLYCPEFSLLPSLFLLFLIPLLDELFSRYDVKLDWKLEPWSGIVWSLSYLFIYGVSLVFVAKGVSWMQFLCICFNLGTLSAMSMTYAHEYFHNHAIESTSFVIASAISWASCQPFFWKMHVAHHNLVGTENDIMTAKKGQNMYNYLWCNFIHVWRNCILVCDGNMAGFIAVLGVTGLVSIRIFTLIVGQGIVCFLLVNTLNYVQHYGLERKIGEIVSEKHAWDSHYQITNYYLNDIGHHQKHHSGVEGGPHLPYNLVWMILFAWCPQLFDKVITNV